MRLSGVEIASATRGHWHGEAPAVIEAVVTDSRSFEPGACFLALRGVNHDGHRYGETVADNAQALIGDQQGMAMWASIEKPKLEVNDTLVALGDIAHAWRLQLERTTVIAITGSYGKTSLRSLLETGFAALGLKVAATRANLNNLIGVPQTLLAVPDDADIAVIECGISERGEMARLAAMVQADVAILTGFTGAHGEGLGGFSGVVSEKARLIQQMNRCGWAAMGEGVASQLKANKIELPSDRVEAGLVDWQLDGCVAMFAYQGEQASITLPLPARHWAANMAFATSIILRYLQKQGQPASLTPIVQALSTWQVPAGRLRALAGRGGAQILDDSYNANPVSMQAAIDTLAAIAGRRIAVLGDMGELGDASQAGHAGLNISALDQVYLVGPRMQGLAKLHPEAIWLADTDAAVAELSELPLTNIDSVLVKASRSMRLDRVVAALTAVQEDAHAL